MRQLSRRPLGRVRLDCLVLEGALRAERSRQSAAYRRDSHSARSAGWEREASAGGPQRTDENETTFIPTRLDAFVVQFLYFFAKTVLSPFLGSMCHMSSIKTVALSIPGSTITLLSSLG